MQLHAANPLHTVVMDTSKAEQLAEWISQETGARGVEGEGFPTFSSIVPIVGVVMAYIGPDNAPQTWGPTFALDPAFSEKEPLLLGRSDCFQTFVVTFEESPAQPTFYLDHV